MAYDVETGRRAQQKRAHRQAILAAAERALGERGDVAVDEIAALAGLAKGTVYNYFGDKAALVETVSQAVQQRVIDQVGQATAHVESPQTRIAIVLCALIKLALSDPGQANIIRDCLNHSSQSFGLPRLLELELRRMASAGALAVEDVRPSLGLILSTARAAMKQAIAGSQADRVEAAALVALCMRAVDRSAERELQAALCELDLSRDVLSRPGVALS